jgi:hypothetical protein
MWAAQPRSTEDLGRRMAWGTGEAGVPKGELRSIPLLIFLTDAKTKRDPEATTMRGDAMMKRGRNDDKEG